MTDIIFPPKLVKSTCLVESLLPKVSCMTNPLLSKLFSRSLIVMKKSCGPVASSITPCLSTAHKCCKLSLFSSALASSATYGTLNLPPFKKLMQDRCASPMTVNHRLTRNRILQDVIRVIRENNEVRAFQNSQLQSSKPSDSTVKSPTKPHYFGWPL